MRISTFAAVGVVLVTLSGCSLLPSVLPDAERPDPSGESTLAGHTFEVVDHYVGVEEVATAAIETACAEPGETWTQEQADARWRMAELLDASEYPSKLLAVKYYIEEAQHMEEFLIDVVRPPESAPAAAATCEIDTDRWNEEITRQKDACADGTSICWSRDLTGADVEAPTKALDPSDYIVDATGPIGDDYVGVHELSEAAIEADCAPRTATWTQEEADRYRDLAELFSRSEYPSALYAQQNNESLADNYDEFLIDRQRTPESTAAAKTACEFTTEMWTAEVTRQEAACAPGSTSASACWSRDLQQ